MEHLIRHKKPGSVRLKDKHYQEMDTLGISNESAYLKYKLQQGASHLEVVQPDSSEQQTQLFPVVESDTSVTLKDQLTIQRLSMENQKLQEKLEEINKHNRETLNGINNQVHTLLQQELEKRDFETLKKEYTQQEKRVEQLEETLEKSKKETQEKQQEIEALVKKLGLVELGKALLPGAISGLAKQYPKQMKGIAGTLGRLGLSDVENTSDTADQDSTHLLQIMEYIQQLYTEEQFEQALQLLLHIGEQIKYDTTLIEKTVYYIDQVLQKKKSSDKDAV
ncbi:hypothetical protein [Aquimarina longa]|uniref:hypothetical protein n=1 Tax=Aquimarina longa TaxID=1080221 RepID=UPI0007853809|nr:hypothetical protein [Aquimarina longa]